MNGFHRRPRALVASRIRALTTSAAFAVGGAACLVASPRPAGELESRYATVHNALTGIGMSEVGALHDAQLAEGQEARLQLELTEGCTTIVAVGGRSIVDLDAALHDPAGARIARATAHSSEATIRACVETAGTYVLQLKSTHGAGSLLVSTWSGATPVDPTTPSARTAEGSGKPGTCDAPIALSAGSFTGSTAHGEKQNEAKACSSTNAAEMVYKLEVTKREKVSLAVETQRFDSVLYLRKGDCSDQDAEVACNDDAPAPGSTQKDTKHSRVTQVLDPGTYFAFVDGYSGAGGTFKLDVEVTDVPPLAELCDHAPLLSEGTPLDGTLDGAFDEAGATCGDGARGPDSVYTFALAARSRVRITEHSDDFAPVVHLRSTCADPDSAGGCSDSSGVDHSAAYVDLLDPGNYAIFADASDREATGKLTLKAETAPELGSGARGERCADAIPLSKADPSVTGDTFAARDDVAGRCGGTGAPDVVYRLDVAARTRFTAHVTREESNHLLVLMRGCGGPKLELDCGKKIERVLAPGSYFLAVDGESPASFGAYTFEWATRDTQAEDVACRAPVRLKEGETVNGTTIGAVTDKFTPTCAAADAGSGAPDLVYQLVVPTRRRVHLHLHSTGWGAVLSVRKACVEGDTAAVSASELECHAEDAPDVDFDSTIDAGTYYVIIDGRDPSSTGAFSLDYRVAPH
jgi:hypothetical protein